MAKFMGKRRLTALVLFLAVVLIVATFPLTKAFATPTQVNDTSGSITYSGAWTYDNATVSVGYYSNDQHYSSTNGNYAQFTFTGTSIQWIGPKNVDLGITQVYIDGVLSASVDMYASSWLKQQVLYSNTSLSNASHTIKLVVTNTKNAASSGYYSSVDAFSYDAPVVTTTLTTVHDTDPGITYSGTWTYGSAAGYENSDQHYSNTNGSYAQFTFTGTAIQWIGPKNVDCGISDVYIDGVKVASVDMYASTLRMQQVLYSNTNLTNASHTIKVVVTNTRNSANTMNYYSSIDAFLYGSPGTAPTWNLNTTDTNLTLTLAGNQPAITQLKNPTQNWNWTPTTTIVPLMNRVTVGSTPYTLNWVYQDATVDTTSGTKVTLRFTSTSPALELKSIWWARPGVGPVEESVTIQNNTGSNVTYNHADVLSNDFTVSADNTVTLNRYDRASVNPSASGVYQDVFAANTNVASTVANDFNTGPWVLPYEMLDRGAVHGLYLGYVWDFGKIMNSTSGNALQIRNQFYLGDSGSVTEASGKIFNVPGMFFGTYKGDTDTGSNAMKKWFWNYKMTPTLKANTNEPLVEYDVNYYSEASINTFLTTDPINTWGVELAKEDAWWTSDVYTDPNFGWAWTPNTTNWPNGFNLGTTIHNKGMLLSLYMGNRYQHNDLATQAGRDAEKAALLTRYDNYHYDYWRSDMESENTNDYLSHEGFLEVLDYMIGNRAGFRWENCSAGGSKKSFDFLQRQTVMTTEDSGNSPGSVENYRRAFYANSFMINSIQMKADNLDYTINTPTFANYEFRTGFLSAWMYGNPSNASTVQPAVYQANIALYKSKQRPILRGADVYHILPIADGVNWDGMQYFNTSLNKGSVLLFHPSASAPTSKIIKLKGLDSAATYTITFQDRTAQNTTMTGADLMNNGINVTGMTGDYASEIMWIN
ncbi:hypothetical protein A8709_15185 [Paenibacillus pectinilyticus]|uniref:Glycosyl hydrolase family 36 C-terminal domain-containing protein n=1 Tax=Paenibacillus pectinilyticus TaxID=512399 RepID=A0A1C1A4C9_9BACL|nr:GH36 C-terminal domain-containing protein [Paenibacillus pectinilyticus]OCT15422.1 hypothetical protein A8709_15185 [Paenibacillus pectinilyticus]